MNHFKEVLERKAVRYCIDHRIDTKDFIRKASDSKDDLSYKVPFIRNISEYWRRKRILEDWEAAIILAGDNPDKVLQAYVIKYYTEEIQRMRKRIPDTSESLDQIKAIDKLLMNLSSYLVSLEPIPKDVYQQYFELIHNAFGSANLDDYGLLRTELLEYAKAEGFELDPYYFGVITSDDKLDYLDPETKRELKHLRKFRNRHSNCVGAAVMAVLYFQKHKPEGKTLWSREEAWDWIKKNTKMTKEEDFEEFWAALPSTVRHPRN